MRFFDLFAVLAPVVATQAVPTSTIIDVLSSRPEFSDILKLIQARGLVPLINDSWNTTFLAPVNSAFIGVDLDEISKDQLLYHLVNTTVYSEDITDNAALYYTYLDDGQAPISLSLSRGVNDRVEFDEVDLLASPQRGLVHAIDGLVEIPKPVADAIYFEKGYRAFAPLVDLAEVNLNGSALLVPRNSAVKNWLAAAEDVHTAQPIMQYLRSPLGKRDRVNLIERHAIPNVVYALQAKKFPKKITLMDGSKAWLHRNLSLSGHGYNATTISSVEVARDGVLVRVDSIAADNAASFLDLTLEKIIMGLGGYSLVRGLSLYGHRHLIDGTDSHKERTIIVPTGDSNDHLSSWGLLSCDALSDSTTLYSDVHSDVDYDVDSDMSSDDLMVLSDPGAMFMYQFLEGTLPKHPRLLTSLMPLKSGEYAQRVRFGRRPSGDPTLNWENLDKKSYKYGNTTFYTASGLIAAPPSLAMALGPMLISSFSLAFLDKLNRLQLSHRNSWTVFVPNRDAWERNILVKFYLDSNSTALEYLFDNLILKAPIYADEKFYNTSVEQYGGYETEVTWNATRNEFTLRNNALQDTLVAEVTDALFDNGVAHVVNDIPLPQDMEISTADLIRAGGRELFLELLKAAGMEDVLEPAANYTVLVPPTKDLLKFNFTKESEPHRLRDMLKLHLLRGNPLESLFLGNTATTLAGEDLEIESIGSSRLFALSPISATEGQRVMLYEFGSTNGRVANGSSVVFTDQHISPLWILPPKFGIHRGTYTFFGVLLGLVLTSILVFSLVWLVSRNKEGGLMLDEEAHFCPHLSHPQHRQSSHGEDEDRDQSTSAPIETPGSTEDRAYGRHLGLPN